MLSDETEPTTYHLFDHSYHGGSWNMALIEQVDAQKCRAEKAEARAAAAEAEVAGLQIEINSLVAGQQQLLDVLLRKVEALEVQARALVGPAIQNIEEINRLRYVVDAFAQHRRHVYFCEDCGDGEPCEEGDDLYSAALTAVDSVCGKPSGESEGLHGN